MARFKQGVHGGFKGRVGNIVGSDWKGTGVMRIRPASVSNPRTDLQQNVRTRFALMGHFLSTQRELVRIGWRAMVENSTTPHNMAMRYNLANAVVGEYPDLSIDFSKIKLSFGTLPVPEGFQAVAASANSLNLSWQNTAGSYGSGDNDLLMLGLYDVSTGEGFTLVGGFTRQQETALITLPANWAGRTLEVFAFMVSSLALVSLNDPSHVSSTWYAGSVVLAD